MAELPSLQTAEDLLTAEGLSVSQGGPHAN